MVDERNAGRMEPSTDPLIGAVFDGCYRIDRLIGDGGMGRVYRATHELLELPVAVKILDPYLASQPNFVERFEREAEVMASIQHENVVKQFDSGRAGRHIYFVMELLEGQELSRLVGHGRRMPWTRLEPIAVQLTRALAAAHVVGVVHRDMKPANIFLVDDGRRKDVVKVLDFGIAKTNDGPRLTRTNMIIGTASYISPEQVTGGEVDGRSDVYSLGCILFEALTGRPPFVGDTPVEILGQHVHARPPRLRAVAPEIALPEGLEALINQTLAKRKVERIPTMRNLELELLALADVGVVAAAPTQTRSRGGEGRRRSNPDDHKTAELNAPPAQAPPEPTAESTLVDTDDAPARPYWSAPQLADFALLCLAFALRPGEGLGVSARHALEVRLLYWAPHLSGDIIAEAMRSAEAGFATRGASDWTALVQRVAVSIPREWYGQLAIDLFEQGLEDGRLSEAQLRVSSWISEELEREAGPTLLCLTVLWLTLGPGADESMATRGIVGVVDDLRAWAPGLPASDLGAIVDRVHDGLEEGGRGRVAGHAYARAASEWLLRTLDEDGLRRVLADAWRIAGAGGHIPESTQHFILEFAARVADAKRGGARERERAPELPELPELSEELDDALEESLEAMDYLLDALAADRPPMQELAEVTELLWRGNAELLSAEAELVARRHLLPALRERGGPAHRRLALVLTLLELELESLDQPALVLDLYEELDAAGRRALLDGLAYWDDPRANDTAVAGMRRFTAVAPRRAWLALCVERNCQLEHDELELLLQARDRSAVAAGLALVCASSNPERHAARVDRLIDEGSGRVREAALVTGLILDRPSAAPAVKQAARDPSMARACEAHAATGSMADLKTSIAWARRPAAPAHAGWVLGLIGNISALDACVQRLEHEDPRVVAAGIAGFRLASGFTGTANEAPGWWARRRGEFEGGTRYLDGEASTPDQVRRRLLTASPRLRASIGLRLSLRSHGQLRLPVRRLPSVYVEHVRQLDDVWLR